MAVLELVVEVENRHYYRGMHADEFLENKAEFVPCATVYAHWAWGREVYQEHVNQREKLKDDEASKILRPEPKIILDFPKESVHDVMMRLKQLAIEKGLKTQLVNLKPDRDFHGCESVSYHFDKEYLQGKGTEYLISTLRELEITKEK